MSKWLILIASILALSIVFTWYMTSSDGSRTAVPSAAPATDSTLPVDPDSLPEPDDLANLPESSSTGGPGTVEAGLTVDEGRPPSQLQDSHSESVASDFPSGSLDPEPFDSQLSTESPGTLNQGDSVVPAAGFVDPRSPEASSPTQMVVDEGGGPEQTETVVSPPEEFDPAAPGLAPEIFDTGMPGLAPEASDPGTPSLPPEASDPGVAGPAPEDS